ncbi:MAG: glycosyltransferase family 39 protein [Lachnospiraceae bacterium]|nr:glycosyltransferase family 39 protein [Lachnospiraceae bacterium]MDE7183579.1 glycosyltransferase family 39 protein [Lachnospiraceae bacterium]
MERGNKQVPIWMQVMLFGTVACIALFVHLFHIAEIPNGIHVDEMGMGYDAWCLAHFGVDRYLKSYPVYLMNFGGGQSALYAYLCIPFVKWFGLSPVTLRLPGILLYMVSLFCGAGVFMLDSDDTARRKALTGMVMMTMLPVFMMLFRIGMDCNLMLAMSVIFLFLAARAVRAQRVTAFVAAGFAGGVLLYTYVISYVVMPVFLALALGYLLAVRKIRFCHVLALGIPIAVLSAPLIAVQLVNLLGLPEFQMGPFTITRLFQYRRGEISLGHLSVQSVKDAVMSIFLFDGLRYNTVAPFGTVYYVSLPLIGMGIVKCVRDFAASIRKKEFCYKTLYLLWLAVLFAAGCCMEANTNRLNAAMAAMPVLLVEGIWQTVAWFQDVRMQNTVKTILAVAYLICFSSFLLYYFGGTYAKLYEEMDYFDNPLDEALAFVESDALCSTQTTYISAINQTYIYYLGAALVSPFDFNQDNVFDREDPMIYSKWTAGHGRYRFGMPEQLDWNANYIVDHNNTACSSLLRESGFMEHRLERYSVYTFDLNTFIQMDLKTDVELVWELGMNSQNQIRTDYGTQTIEGVESVVLVGWSYDKKYMSSWDSVYLDLDGKKYYAEFVERGDIAVRLGNEALLECGMLFFIPKAEFDNQVSAELMFIDFGNKVYAKERVEILHETCD